MPTTLTQPDGTRLECFASGDEYHNWLHDKDGYTIIQSQSTGYYSYAQRSGEDIVPSDLIAGRDNPAMRGLVPNINISREAYRELRNTRFQMPDTRDAPTTGTINNLVVFIRFSGEAEFGQTISTYDGWFNSNTSSQKNYFLEASYNQLTVNTTFYPAASGGYVVSWQDSHARGYFQPYNASTNPIGYQTDDESRNREFTLLAAAIAGVGTAVPADLVIDSDNDGKVDNVVFVISGNSDGWVAYYGPISIVTDDNNGPGTPEIPILTALIDNVPNPFNPETSIRYSVEAAAEVELSIYNSRGQFVRSYKASHNRAGYYSWLFDGRDAGGRELSSGVYYCRMTSSGQSYLQRLLLLK